MRHGKLNQAQKNAEPFSIHTRHTFRRFMLRSNYFVGPEKDTDFFQFFTVDIETFGR